MFDMVCDTCRVLLRLHYSDYFEKTDHENAIAKTAEFNVYCMNIKKR